uniref:Ig-like domain-containing protein n=1 Tax=Oryzias latipes TaxID=8090 RepID=A0A3P9LI00_ORYLA
VHSFIFYCVLIPFGVTGCWSLSLPLAGKRREHPGQLSDFVYLYWNRQIMTTYMSESILRVSLDQDGLKRGDVTLKIRNVSLQDEGKYSCFIPGKNFRETVQLNSPCSPEQLCHHQLECQLNTNIYKILLIFVLIYFFLSQILTVKYVYMFIVHD